MKIVSWERVYNIYPEFSDKRSEQTEYSEIKGSVGLAAQIVLTMFKLLQE